jgi:hypothetical protein
MARIKIGDLPADMKISPEEMKKVFGGAAKSLTQIYGNPLDVTSRVGIIDPIDPRGINIPPVTSDPSVPIGTNVSITKACAETWGGT